MCVCVCVCLYCFFLLNKLVIVVVKHRITKISKLLNLYFESKDLLHENVLVVSIFGRPKTIV